MTDRTEKINALSDQQALSIVSSLAAETADLNAPAGLEAQKQVLQTVLAGYAQQVDVEAAAKADEASSGAAARALLVLLADAPELQASLDEWLEEPPSQEQAAIPLLLAAPAIFSGCVAALYVIGHLQFNRDAEGKWTFAYRPDVETPMDKNMKDLAGAIAKLMGGMLPGK